MTAPEERQTSPALRQGKDVQSQVVLTDREGRDAFWRSRGYLPHFEASNTAQSVTFRLAGSLPEAVLAQIEVDDAGLPWGDACSARRKRIEEWLDQGAGACHLADPRIASVVAGAIRFLDGRKYHIHAWVVMPNHVHILFTPIPPATLAVVAHSLKSYTAKEANRLLGSAGPFWQREYYDRAIRDIGHFNAEIAYIEANPVKAGLGYPLNWTWLGRRIP